MTSNKKTIRLTTNCQQGSTREINLAAELAIIYEMIGLARGVTLSQDKTLISLIAIHNGIKIEIMHIGYHLIPKVGRQPSSLFIHLDPISEIIKVG